MSAKNLFLKNQKALFNAVADALFAKLETGEDLNLKLAAEDSLFVRFNNGRVRQNTSVEQVVVTLEFHSGQRTHSRTWTLTGHAVEDIARGASELAEARKIARELPEDKFQVPMQNNGLSENEYLGSWPEAPALIEEIASTAQDGLDLAGLLCAGSVIAANRNSKGQSHWFGTQSFFLDYSLFNGERAAKGLYAGLNWGSSEWSANLAWTHEQLKLLAKPICSIKPGQYRTYLAPDAVGELMATIGWGGFSYSVYKQGLNPLRKAIDGELRLSSLLTIGENFSLGLTPAFNGLGEVSAAEIPMVQNGRVKSLLTSSRTAREYGATSNAASDWETPRSLEVKSGSLEREDVLRELGTGLYLSNLHYLNWSDRTSARITGMTRYACFWVEEGKIVGPIKDLRFDVSLFEALGANLRAVTSFTQVHPETGTYGARSLGGRRTPGFLIDSFPFTL